MGYDQSERRTVWTLRFDDQFRGLTVRVRKPGFRGLKMIRRAVLVLGENLSDERDPAFARLDAWGLVFSAFADSLLDWDLTDDGVRVPPTVGGVMSQDHEFLISVARVWYTRVVLARPPKDVEPETDTTDEPESTEDVPTPDELMLADLPVELTQDQVPA